MLALEAHIDTLGYLLDIEIMVAARGDPRDAQALVGVSTVAAATDKISDAAADIAAIVTRDIGVHPIVGSIFEKVEERLMKATVKEGSVIIRKADRQTRLSRENGHRHNRHQTQQRLDN